MAAVDSSLQVGQGGLMALFMNDATSMASSQIETRDEGNGVLAITHRAAPGCKVQISPNNGRGTFGAFASCDGAGSTIFCGKSWKTQAGAIKAATKWLEQRVGSLVPVIAPAGRGEAPAAAWVADALDAFEEGRNAVVVRDNW